MCQEKLTKVCNGFVLIHSTALDLEFASLPFFPLRTCSLKKTRIKHLLKAKRTIQIEGKFHILNGYSGFQKIIILLIILKSIFSYLDNEQDRDVLE